MKRSFASDNNSGVSPEIMNAILQANEGDFIAYGDDPFTKKAEQKFKEIFGDKAEVFFVATGTGSNVLSLYSILKPFEAVITAESAHINTDECGAPEKITGSKILTVKTPVGKISPNLLGRFLHYAHGEHSSVPKLISITESTELGTVYTPDEISQIAEFAHSNGMLLHMDGARIANAAASLNCSFKDITTLAGVDVLSFGGTKNGMMMGEAVVFLRGGLSEDVKFLRKQSTQLVSKMRYISAQFLAYFDNDLWRKNAENANKMAKLLADEAKKIKGIEIVYPVQANAVFVKLPKEKIERFRQKTFFYVWDAEKGIVRWMTSFATTEEDVYEFLDLIKSELSV